MPERKRKYIPLSVKLAVVLKQAHCARCGEILGNDAQFDHIELHTFTENDSVENLQAIHKDCHHIKTVGTHIPLSGDISKAAKAKRLEKKHADFRNLLISKTNRAVKVRSKWPSRKFKGKK